MQSLSDIVLYDYVWNGLKFGRTDYWEQSSCLQQLIMN